MVFPYVENHNFYVEHWIHSVMGRKYQWLDDRGRHIVDYIEGQDVMAWVSQGKIADRTSEHIGKSDIGVIMIRRMFKAQIARVEPGKDPTVAFTRVPQERIELPCEKKKFTAGIDFALAWLDMGSTRYSPALDTLRKIHLEATRARGEVPNSYEYAVRQPFGPDTPRTM